MLARFHRYSFGNALLIAAQRPEATHVAGFHTWRKLGRFVKKGEHGIAILAPMVVAKWERLIGVSVRRVFIRRMKTKWGSCNHRARTIRLNTDLAKKPPQCLEYIVVHEMVHLLELTHNAHFQRLLSQFLPNWRSRRDALNRLPVRHERWEY